jgi:hypothetical protein
MYKESIRKRISVELTRGPKTFGELWEATKHHYRSKVGLAKLLKRMDRDGSIERKDNEDGKRIYFITNKSLQRLDVRVTLFSVQVLNELVFLIIKKRKIKTPQDLAQFLGRYALYVMSKSTEINDAEKRKTWLEKAFSLDTLMASILPKEMKLSLYRQNHQKYYEMFDRIYKWSTKAQEYSNVTQSVMFPKTLSPDKTKTSVKRQSKRQPYVKKAS